MRGWLVDVLLLVLLAALTAALAAGALLDLDIAVRDWVDAHRPQPWYVAARALNYLGQGGALVVVALLAAAWLARRAHSVRPLLPVVAAYAGIYLLIGPVKVLTDRVAPHHESGAADLFTGGMSYPSGHAANTIVWYGVLTLLLAEALPSGVRVALRTAPALIVAVATTYLGFHWLTDTIAGILIGLLLDRLLRRIDWNAVPLRRLPGARRLDARGWAGPVPSLRRTLR
jgi:membrane-associated phospholipid phosphatase